MTTLIELFGLVDCCKNNMFVSKHCVNLPICFSANHTFGLASVESYYDEPTDYEQGYFGVPVFVGYYLGEKYLSYDQDGYNPVKSNRLYKQVTEDETIYRYITVNANGKIIAVNLP